jgi:hypothetical protein
MNPDPYGEAVLPFLLHAPLQRLESLDNAQPCAYSTLGIVFVRSGITEIDQQPIAQILGDVPLKALNDLRADGMIGPHHLAQLLKVQTACERRRIHQVTKQHRQMATFGLRFFSPCAGGTAHP